MFAVKKYFALFTLAVFSLSPGALLSAPASATDFVSTLAGGLWADTNTWLQAGAPTTAGNNVKIQGPVTFDDDYEIGNLDLSVATGSLEYVGANAVGVITFTGLLTAGGSLSDVDLIVRGNIDASLVDLDATKIAFDTADTITISGTIAAPIELVQDVTISSTGMIFNESVTSDGNSITLSNASPQLTIEDILDEMNISSNSSGSLTITGEISDSITYDDGGNSETVVLDGADIGSDSTIEADVIEIQNSLFVGAKLTLNARDNINATGSVNGTGDVYFNSDMTVTDSWSPSNTFFYWEEDAQAVSYEYQYATSIGDIYTNPVATTSVAVANSNDLTALIGSGQSLYIWYRSVFADTTTGDWSDFVSVNKEANSAPAIETDNQTGGSVSVSVVEGATAVTTATSTDPEGNAITSFTLSGGDDASKFNVVSAGNTLAIEFKDIPDFEIPTDNDQDNNYEIVLSATDILGSTGSQSVTIVVTDLTTEPVFTNPEDGSIEEGSGDTFEITVIEPDNQDVTISIDPNSPDAGALGISTTSTSTAEISFVGGGDYDAEADDDQDNTYLVTVIAEDTDGNQAFQNIEIELEDVNESAPVFTNPNGLTSYQIPSTETEITTLTATDTDIDDDQEYGIATSTDAALFEIVNDETLAFKTNAAIGTYAVSVSVTDGDFITVQSVTVEVLDGSINYAPEFTSFSGAASSTTTIEENNATTTQIATLTAQDFNNDSLEFSIATSSLDGALFEIDQSTGEIVTTVSFDFEDTDDTDQDNIYEVEFIVSDGGLEDSFVFFIEVTNASDINPINTSATSTSVIEGETDVIVLAATDEDGDDIFWSLAGTDSLYLSVGSTTGEVVFATTTIFTSPVDDNRDNVYEIETIVTDSSGATSSADLFITVTEAPVVVVSSSSGGGGGSSSRRACRDPEAANYETFGTSDPDKCQYEQSDSEDEQEEQIVVLVTQDESNQVLASSESNLGPTVSIANENVQEIETNIQSSDDEPGNSVQEDQSATSTDEQTNEEAIGNSSQAASLIAAVEGDSPWWPPFAAATIAVIGFYFYRKEPTK